MKSNKQRRTEIKAHRAARAAAVRELDPRWPAQQLPLGTIAADPAKLAHNNTYGLLPSFYRDQPFSCVDCGSAEVWTAKQQKWWYEELQKPIDSRAIRCRTCRQTRRTQLEARGDAALLLRREVRALRALGDQTPSTAARHQLDAALCSKWDGLRATAVKTLCRWGDSQSLRRAREALAQECAGAQEASVSEPMAKALASHLRESDWAWVLDLYLNGAHRNHRWQLHPLLQAFGAPTVRAKLAPLRGHMLDAEGERELSTLLHWADWVLKRSS